MTINYFSDTRTAWKETWKQKKFRWQFVLTVLSIVWLGIFFPGYFDYLEARNGTVLHDFLVDNIPPHDVSWMIFFLLYVGVGICIACNLHHPKNLLIAFQTYSLVTIMRIFTLYVAPLNPPVGYVCLREPVLSMFFTNNGKICSHDLFFSGHVSSILSAYFSVKQKMYKNILLIFSVMIGLLVLVQHVHYTVDVIAAPIGTYFCYRLSKKMVLKKD